jgi:tRNA A-37 threonylcarbamoyl transferase component Bud32/tetratricopeptide (TPR) repeat protein
MIGRYVVLGRVGHGGMGEVYAAYDPELDRKVAVKLVRAHGDSGLNVSEKRARLLREAQAIAKLSHPNVVVVFDVGTFDQNVFIAMEFVEGQTVGAWLGEPRSWREILAVYRAAGRGLVAAHGAGVIHRDFKPENVMVARDGQVRVMDFGLATQTLENERATPAGGTRDAEDIARAVTARSLAALEAQTTASLSGRSPVPAVSASGRRLESKLTETGAMLGTPAYMAPEQFSGKPADPRTDQFSFCVSLYESLYGERPFAGRSPAALMTNVLTGAISEPPPDARVPAWIRRILLRGLRRHPAERFPSMEALLEALAHDASRTQRRLVTAAAVTCAVVGIGAASVGFRVSKAAAPSLCGSGAPKLAGVWEIGAGGGARGGAAPTPRRDAVHRAFAATGKSFAESAFGSVAQILDRYLGTWAGMYEDACRATHVRGEQSAEVLDLRMSCLAERLDRARALTDLFTAANATVVENAVAAASALPSFERCADVQLLRAVLPPPENPGARARVEALRRQLAQVKALGDSGQCAAGAAAASKLVDESFTLGYLPLQAEALNALALFGNECTDPGRAVRQFKEAHWAAQASHHDEAAAEALIQMAQLGAGRLHDPGAARDWIQLAGAILKRMGPGHPALEASQLAALGIITSREGQMEEGLADLERSLALKEKTLGAEHVDVVRTLNSIGMVLEEMGRPGESVVFYDRARAMALKLVGPDHPLLALTLANEGQALDALHRYDEARPLLERAVAIWRGAGSGPFYLAYALTSLGESRLGLGDTSEAQRDLEEALSLYAQSPAASFPAARFALARALWATPQARRRAIVLAHEARDEYEQSAAPAWRVAEIDGWLAKRAH